MTNKKKVSQLGIFARGLDGLIITAFILGVVFVIGLFIYVLSMDVASKV